MKLFTLCCALIVLCGCGAPETCQTSEEVCDGVDNDCNGAVDDIRQESCYTGNPIEPAFGSCKAGKTACEGGAQVCVGEVHPTAEVCDGIDNDCDGQVDEQLLGSLNVVVVVDNSYETAPYLSSVESGISMAASMMANNDIQWGMSTGGPGEVGPIQWKYLSDPETFLNMKWVNTTVEESSTVDALHALATDDGNVSMKWTLGSKRLVIVFAAGNPHTIFGNDPDVVGQELRTADEEFIAFTRTYKGWMNMGGQVTPISDNPLVIGAEIQQFISTLACGVQP